MTFFDLPIGAQACIAATWMIVELVCLTGFVYFVKEWLYCKDAEDAFCSVMVLLVGTAVSSLAFIVIG